MVTSGRLYTSNYQIKHLIFKGKISSFWFKKILFKISFISLSPICDVLVWVNHKHYSSEKSEFWHVFIIIWSNLIVLVRKMCKWSYIKTYNKEKEKPHKMLLSTVYIRHGFRYTNNYKKNAISCESSPPFPRDTFVSEINNLLRGLNDTFIYSFRDTFSLRWFW